MTVATATNTNTNSNIKTRVHTSGMKNLPARLCRDGEVTVNFANVGKQKERADPENYSAHLSTFKGDTKAEQRRNMFTNQTKASIGVTLNPICVGAREDGPTTVEYETDGNKTITVRVVNPFDFTTYHSQTGNYFPPVIRKILAAGETLCEGVMDGLQNLSDEIGVPVTDMLATVTLRDTIDAD